DGDEHQRVEGRPLGVVAARRLLEVDVVAGAVRAEASRPAVGGDDLAEGHRLDGAGRVGADRLALTLASPFALALTLGDDGPAGGAREHEERDQDARSSHKPYPTRVPHD